MVAPTQNFRTPTARRSGLPLWADVPSFTAFAQEVEEALDTPELPYSRRLELLARARHFGISRFDANLVIAMVQHRAHKAPQSPLLESPRRFSSFTLISATVTQLVIVAAIWWLMA